MNELNFSHIDQQFFEHFQNARSPVTDPEALWLQIDQKRKKEDKWFLYFLLSGVLLVGFTVVSSNHGVNSNVQANETQLEDEMGQLFGSKSHFLPDTIHSLEAVKLDHSNSINYDHPESSDDQLFVEPISGRKQAHGDLSKSKSPAKTEINIQNKRVATSLHLRESNLDHSTTPSEEATKDRLSEPSLAHLKTLPTFSKFEPLKYTGPVLLENDMQKIEPCRIGNSGNPFVEVYVQGGGPLENVDLNAGQSSELIPYRDLWKERNSTLFTVTGGIMLGYAFPWKGSISAGIEYQHIEAQYQAQQTVTEQITVFDPMAYFFYDTNNEIVWVGDSVTAVSTYERIVSHANTYTLINLPLQFAYDFVDRGPLRVSGTLGVTLNISQKFKGQFLRSDLSLVQVNSDIHPGYISKSIGMGITAGGRLGYRLAPRWEAYISPRFRYNRQNVLDPSQNLSISRHFVSLRTGLQFQF